MQPLAAEPEQRAARPVRFGFQVDVAESVVHAVEAGGCVGVDLLPGRQVLVEETARMPPGTLILGPLAARARLAPAAEWTVDATAAAAAGLACLDARALSP